MSFLRLTKPKTCGETADQLFKVAKKLVETTGHGAALVISGPCPETGFSHNGWFMRGPPEMGAAIIAFQVATLDGMLQSFLHDEPAPLPSEWREKLLRFHDDLKAARDRAFPKREA